MPDKLNARLHEALDRLQEISAPRRRSVAFAESLIALASKFVCELHRSGNMQPLLEGAGRFEDLTAPDSLLDRCRLELRSSVLNCSGADEGIVTSLESTEHVVWDLEGALGDVGKIGQLTLDDATRLALEKWADLLRDLVAHERWDNIFGCYLIHRCFITDMSQCGKTEDDKQDLAQRLSRDARRLLIVIQSAAGFLVATLMDPSAVPPTTLPTGTANQQCPVTLRGEHEGPIVRGVEKPRLTHRRFKAVKALVDVWPKGLTKDRLDEKSGVSEARKALSGLRENDLDWAAAIVLPGKAGRGGYRIATQS